ncbi:MAG: phosphatidylserine decarboxylase [Planctomycetota bacterium]|jgi:phosphatidylserine decarboxylase
MESIQYIDRQTGQLQTESPPGEGFLRFLYHNPFGAIPLHLLVKRKCLSALYGKLMDRPASRNKIQSFVDQYNINMDEASKAIDEFTSFNDFFYRSLKPDARPIQEGLVSPADGKIIAFENVDQLKQFFVKGNPFTLSDFLQDEVFASTFKNASLFLIRLAPNDYHRFHFPYAGNVSPIREIKGSYFSVSPYAIMENFARIFCENKREYCILSTEDIGDVLISPVGATMVGAIVETYQPDSHVNKGNEMGYFAFGGSSILVLADSNKITIEDDILTNTQKGLETSIRMGERIGQISESN